MATSTIVQLLQAGEAGDTSNRRQIETFIAGGTIAAGDCVGFDTTKTGADRALFVTEAGTVAIGNSLAIGVALNAATADQQVRCVVAGYAENVSAVLVLLLVIRCLLGRLPLAPLTPALQLTLRRRLVWLWKPSLPTRLISSSSSSSDHRKAATLPSPAPPPMLVVGLLLCRGRQ